MKLSANWIREWVQIDKDAAEIAALLTDGGLEVDGMEAAVADIKGVVVGEITAIEKHPDADRLNVCQVNLGSETAQIVCGAANARLGLKAPVATVGTELPNGLKIKKAKLRGVESSGMLCSEAELGLADESDGLMELGDDAVIGSTMVEYFGGLDTIIDIDITPNRGDCFSMLGVARDLSAKANVALTPLKVMPIKASIDRVQQVKVQEPEDCAVFAGRIIEGLNPDAVSPQWLQERLRRCGLRSISPLVDITNLVMMELGQPMHAYDAEKLNGTLSVRFGNGEEKLTLIDGKEVTVSSDTLLVCDEKGPLGLGGIMGGASSAIDENTTTVYLEAAWWHPNTIAGRMRRYGLATDAGQRFERGVDRAGQVRAIERATELVLDICGGDAGPVQVEGTSVGTISDIPLRAERIERLLGMAVPIEEASKILTRLRIDHTVDLGSSSLKANCPSWRFDIEGEWDLIEEVARIKGYDAFPTRAPVPIATHEVGSESDVELNRIIDRMVDLGYREVINYSFVDAERHKLFYGEQSGIALMNPIASDLSLMRDGLVPSLMAVAEHNINHQHRDIRIFEIGRRYFIDEKGTRQEQELLAALISGNRSPIGWAVANEPVDFYDIKGDIERLLAGHGVLDFERVELSWLHPGRSAQLLLDGNVIGVMGQVHPEVAQAYNINQEVYVLELELNAILRQQRPSFSAFSTYPAVKRDLAFLLNNDISADRVITLIRQNGGENLVDVTIFDVFRQEKAAASTYSLAFSLTFQSNFSTLVDADVDTHIERITDSLTKELGAQLRN